MKISMLQTNPALLLAEHEKSHKIDKKGDLFSSELMHSEEELSTEHLKELLDKIDDQGTKLTETPTFSELKDYRDLIKEFIGEAVSRMYTTQSQNGWDRQGRQKAYTLVKNVDSKLSDMAEEIRTGQATALSIIEKHGEIRGMLVDMYM